MSKLLITADWHLSTTLPHGKLDSRWQDLKANIEYVVQYAIDNNIEHFLILGDIYHTNNPDPKAEEKLFFEYVERLLKNDIKVHLISGNHDINKSSGASALDNLQALKLPNVYIYKTLGDIYNGDDFSLYFYRFAYKSEILTPEIAQKGSEYQLKYIGDYVNNIIQNQELSDKKLHIGCFHYTISGCNYSEDGNGLEHLWGAHDIILNADLISEKFDMNFAGHIHPANQQVKPNIHYTGNILATDFGEKSNKGFFIVDTTTETKEFIIIPDQKALIKMTIDLSQPIKSLDLNSNDMIQLTVSGTEEQILKFNKESGSKLKDIKVSYKKVDESTTTSSGKSDDLLGLSLNVVLEKYLNKFYPESKVQVLDYFKTLV